MKLVKEEVEKIAELYNLGKVKSFKLISGGLVNYNYDLKTEDGEFIIRILGKKEDYWKREMLKLEKSVLFYLKDKSFPYEFPIPIMNRRKKYYSKVKGRTYWIYEKLKGDARQNINDKKLISMARALAEYHKYIKNFRPEVNLDEKEIFSLNWFLEQYELMKKRLKGLKKMSKEDKLIWNNFYFFKRLIEKLSKINFKLNMLVCHGDFIKNNILFKKDKVSAFLDFDNLKIAPRVEDVSYTMRITCVGKNGVDKKRMNLFLKEYEKKIKLSRKEKEMIVPLMIRGNVIVFWWMSEEMQKGQDKKYLMIKETVEKTKRLVEEWKR